MVAGLAAGLSVLALQCADWQQTIPAWLVAQLAGGQDITAVSAASLATVAGTVLPVGLAAIAAIIGTGFLQTGMAAHAASVLPDIARISPQRGLRRLFGIETLMAAGRALAKLLLLGAIGLAAARDLRPVLAGVLMQSAAGLVRTITAALVGLTLRLVGAQLVLALIDLLLVRFRHARSLRMSRTDLREESKDTDGNPEARQRLRQMARMRARRRMMAAVPTATVIVTNPTHYAVALAYRRGDTSSPRVVAKGADEIAARIRDIARTSRVPIVANPPLARALYRVEIDTEIPAEHFRAVAEIIAYIWRLDARVGVR